MIDHHTTANKLDQQVVTLANIRDQYCTTVGSKRACSDIIDDLLGLADYHRAQAAATDANILTRMEHYLENMIAEIKANGNDPEAWLEEETLLHQIRSEQSYHLEPVFPAPKPTASQTAAVQELNQAARRVLQPTG